MKDKVSSETSRRKFLGSILPACAVTCLGSTGTSALPFLKIPEESLQEVHKFEKELDRKFTYLQLLQNYNRAMVNLARTVEKKYGKDAPGGRTQRFEDADVLGLLNHLHGEDRKDGKSRDEDNEEEDHRHDTLLHSYSPQKYPLLFLPGADETAGLFL